jgi:hypothetical protein
MKIIYNFGEEKYEYRPSWRELYNFLRPVLIAKLKKTRKEIEKMLENDEFFEEQCEKHKDILKDWFNDVAEMSYNEDQIYWYEEKKRRQEYGNI